MRSIARAAMRRSRSDSRQRHSSPRNPIPGLQPRLLPSNIQTAVSPWCFTFRRSPVDGDAGARHADRWRPRGCRSEWWRCRRGRAVPARNEDRRLPPAGGWQTSDAVRAASRRPPPARRRPGTGFHMPARVSRPPERLTNSAASPGVPGERRPAVLQIALDPVQRRAHQRHQTLPSAFPDTVHESLVLMQGGHLQRHGLADSQPAGVDHLEQRPVAQPGRRGGVHGCQHAIHIGRAEDGRQLACRPRRLDQRGRIGLRNPFRLQEPIQRPERADRLGPRCERRSHPAGARSGSR